MSRKMNGAALVASVIGIILGVVSAEGDPYQTGEWSYDNFPNPQKNVNHCGRRGNTSYVCDPNLLITYEEANDLDVAIKNVMATTKCPCSEYACNVRQGARPGGYRIAIVLVKKMATVSPDATFTQKTDAAKTFTFYLNNNGWRTFGNCDELTIIFFSYDDGIFYFMTGRDARLVLKDDAVLHILQQSSKVIESRGLYLGLRDAVDRLGLATHGNYQMGGSGSTGGGSTVNVLSLSSLILTSVLLQFLQI